MVTTLDMVEKGELSKRQGAREVDLGRPTVDRPLAWAGLYGLYYHPGSPATLRFRSSESFILPGGGEEAIHPEVYLYPPVLPARGGGAGCQSLANLPEATFPPVLIPWDEGLHRSTRWMGKEHGRLGGPRWWPAEVTH